MNNLQTSLAEEAKRNPGAKKFLFNSIIPRIKQLGFEHCLYRICIPFPLDTPFMDSIGNYPSGWNSLYREKRYITRDPIIQHCWSSQLPIIWNPDSFEKNSGFQRDLLMYDIHYGWSQASHSSNGIIGMLSISRKTQAIDEIEILEKSYPLNLLCHYMHSVAEKDYLNSYLNIVQQELTNRERAIIRFTANGRSSKDIAYLLGIKERTVNFHINNINRKLNVTNKRTAVAYASLLGLLRPQQGQLVGV